MQCHASRHSYHHTCFREKRVLSFSPMTSNSGIKIVNLDFHKYHKTLDIDVGSTPIVQVLPEYDPAVLTLVPQRASPSHMMQPQCFLMAQTLPFAATTRLNLCAFLVPQRSHATNVFVPQCLLPHTRPLHLTHHPVSSNKKHITPRPVFICSGTRRHESSSSSTTQEHKDRQTRAPWHREGSNLPPVSRPQSTKTMTKGFPFCPSFAPFNWPWLI